jgi:hypothetical protein
MIVTCSICGEIIAQTILGRIFGEAADDAAHRLLRHHPQLAAGLIVVSPLIIAVAVSEAWRRLK